MGLLYTSKVVAVVGLSLGSTGSGFLSCFKFFTSTSKMIARNGCPKYFKWNNKLLNLTYQNYAKVYFSQENVVTLWLLQLDCQSDQLP